MRSIITYIKSFFLYWRTKRPNTPTNQELKKGGSPPPDAQEYIGSLSFAVTIDSDIDVSYALPNVEHIETSQISVLAERYAEFLMAIHEGYLRDDVVKMIQNHVNKRNNMNETLFWENVITFWALLHVEAQEKKRQNTTDQPLIRPLSAFNNSGT